MICQMLVLQVSRCQMLIDAQNDRLLFPRLYLVCVFLTQSSLIRFLIGPIVIAVVALLY